MRTMPVAVPVTGRGVQKRYPAGRVCTTKRCTTILSVYNEDSICARCFETIPLDDLPTTVGRFL